MGYLDSQKRQMNPYDMPSDGFETQKPQDQVDFGSAFLSPASQNTTAALNSGSQAPGGIDAAQVGSAAAAGSAGGPYGAAIAAAGSLLSQYLGQQAMSVRAKREKAAAIAKGHGEDQQQAISQIMANNARALR